jgi:hypothetical protein
MTYQVLLQRMNDIQLNIKDVREAQVAATRDSRETAIKLEHVLGRINEFSRLVDTAQNMEQNIIKMDLRLELVESKIMLPPVCIEEKHEERIRRIERSHLRFFTAVIAAVVIINLMLFIGKEVM